MFRRIAITVAALTAAALLVASPRQAAAGLATANLAVSARVLGVCTISAATLDFGNYDPSAAGDLDAPAAPITVRCTNGTQFHVDLGTGMHAAGSTRQMVGGSSSETLRYELYSDAAHNTVWATGSNNNATTVAAGLSDYTLQVYGRVFAGQNVSMGTYTDTVTMTVQF